MAKNSITFSLTSLTPANFQIYNGYGDANFLVNSLHPDKKDLINMYLPGEF